MSETDQVPEQDSEETMEAGLTGHSSEEIARFNEQAAAEHGEPAETVVEPEELEEGMLLLAAPNEEGA